MNLVFVLFILLAISLVVNTVGFRYFVYFVSIGYTFSIVGMCLAALLIFHAQFNIFAALQMTGLLIWGLRLGVFVLRREAQPSYQKEKDSIQKQYGGITLPVQLLIWVFVSLLYVFMFLPPLFNLSNASLFSAPLTYAFELGGATILFGGLILETIADRQKSAFKTRYPRQFCNVGLYRWVRCPNYLGEILVWLGSWVMAIPCYADLWQWLGSLIGFACVVLVMMGSTKRLEISQDERYGKLPEYQMYIRSTPVLFPFLPIYTLKNVRATIG
jgi:steroid 5-alpha reductase family enzyme